MFAVTGTFINPVGSIELISVEVISYQIFLNDFLFFHKEESNLIPVDQLGQKLLKKIGISWNKKYRKQYGPLRKVIHDILIRSPIPRKFYYDFGNMNFFGEGNLN